jgi:hypothetical protein
VVQEVVMSSSTPDMPDAPFPSDPNSPPAPNINVNMFNIPVAAPLPPVPVRVSATIPYNYAIWCAAVRKCLNFELGSNPALRELWLSGFVPVRAALMLWRINEGLPLEDLGEIEDAAEEQEEVSA